MSQLAVNAILDANGGNTATINSMTPTADSLQGFRNRIINGDCRIDQRNAGASVAINDATVYTLDRWRMAEVTDGAVTVQQVTDAPTGFVNSLKITTTTADGTLGSTQYSFLKQAIEGFNVSDLGWGTANAKTVTLSFWVRSSLTGTFSGAFVNDGSNRNYIFEYSIASADTWEYKTIVVPGDTSGTWLTNNSVGIRLRFDYGSGSSLRGTANTWQAGNLIGSTGSVSVIGTLNATFYITGVQLEVGSVATPFERRPYGTELALCQRYYSNFVVTQDEYVAVAHASSATAAKTQAFFFKVPMRATPTVTLSAAGNGAGQSSFLQASNSYAGVGSHSVLSATKEQFLISTSNYTSTSWSTGSATSFYATGAQTVWAASSEL